MPAATANRLIEALVQFISSREASNMMSPELARGRTGSTRQALADALDAYVQARINAALDRRGIGGAP